MPARILPGPVQLVMDHLVITLRDESGRETAFLSLYAIAYSIELGAGQVAVLELAAPAGGPDGLLAVVSDTPGMAERQQARLLRLGDPRAALRVPPHAATFERHRTTPDGFGYDLHWSDDDAAHTLEARWIDPAPPVWVDGEGGAFGPAHDIWSTFVEAPRASLVLDGVPVAGTPFVDDQWRPKLGRPLSSAHAAFAEVRVTPVPAGQ